MEINNTGTSIGTAKSGFLRTYVQFGLAVDNRQATGRRSCCVLLLFSVCVAIPFFLDVQLVDVTVEVTQEEGHTGLHHLPSAVLALIFLARKTQPSLSLVDRDVDFCVPTNYSFSICWAYIYIYIYIYIILCEKKSQFDPNSCPNVRRFRGYQLNHRDLLYLEN